MTFGGIFFVLVHYPRITVMQRRHQHSYGASIDFTMKLPIDQGLSSPARLAQLAERTAFNRMVMGSSPMVGILKFLKEERSTLHFAWTLVLGVFGSTCHLFM